MSATRLAVHVRAYEQADEPQVLALLQASLAGGPTGRRTTEFFRWKHLANPFGRSFALVAEADGQVVGFRTFMRWRFRVGGHAVQAVRAVDTATHPDYQGRGIFTQLTRAAIEQVRGQADLVFNTPNAQSLPGYRKMGWQDVGRVPIALRVVRPLRFLRGVPRATRGAPAGAPPPCALPAAVDVLADDEAVTGLLADCERPDERLATDRSVEYLRWRYGTVPGLDYRAIAVGSGGRLDGLAIVRPRRRGPLAELVLAEVLVRPGDRATSRRLLRSAAHAGMDHVAAHLADDTPAAAVGRRLGYWAVPGQGMTLVANPLSKVRPDPLSLRSWRLSLGDLEVF